MNYLRNVNRRKILPFHILIFAIAIFFISSLIIVKQVSRTYIANSKRIEISDGTEYRYLLERKIIGNKEAKNIIDKYKLPKSNLDPQTFEIKDYLIGENINSILDKDVDDFFNYRNNLVNKYYGGANKLNNLEIGYCEGWKNLIENFPKQVYLIWTILVFTILPVLRSDERILGMDELVKSTFLGKKPLKKTRIINTMEVATILFFLGIGIYTLVVLYLYSMEGYDLLIQNWRQYFIFPYNFNFIQYYMYKLIIGYVDTVFVAFLLLLMGGLIKDLRINWTIILSYIYLTYGLKNLIDFKTLRFAYLVSPLSLLNNDSLILSSKFTTIPIILLLSFFIPLIIVIFLVMYLIIRYRS